MPIRPKASSDFLGNICLKPTWKQADADGRSFSVLIVGVEHIFALKERFASRNQPSKKQITGCHAYYQLEWQALHVWSSTPILYNYSLRLEKSSSVISILPSYQENPAENHKAIFK